MPTTVGKKCASACACMHVRVSIRTLNTHLKSAWCWQPYQQHDAAGMLGKETLERQGWDGAAPSCLIPPAKCKQVMAKGRRLLASEHLAPMCRKLLSVWGAECVSVRYGDTTTVVRRYTQLSRSLWLASSWCNSFLLPLLLFLVTLCIVLYLCWGCLSWDERKKNCVPGFGKRRKTAWVVLQERIHLKQPFLLIGIVKAWQNLWVRILTPGTTLLRSHLPLLPTATIPGSACPKLSLSKFPASVYFPDCRKLLQAALDSINLNLRALGDPSYGCRVKSL